ncbi:MAG: tRNA pseudouridine synthase Pus10 [Methanomethylovorans sp. PtaU1.Bin093]|uniref:tRNA pseudouridine(54/55) synthase Pus10 n=1 Tax=Methanomethylovorans sp. PtaU1.Bin093 TaxID=1811679 RepID=UPI0009D220E7|nr:tRNA pseudouridine(54/55) synthase Pus10 [Methanomethylovorans sp. PtaU1.Bin093]OPY19443.1 MAG: tRNA pseudouridine synthase Pus10 [Methanomethylovorans sp. PtaU1.Bin093]
MSIFDTAKMIIHEGPICDNCMGRQFAKLSTGLTNAQRGNSLKMALAMEGHRIHKEEGDDSLLRELASSSGYVRKVLGVHGEDERCWVCLGLFIDLEKWADLAVAALEGLEYSSFLVGTKVSGLLSENEEILWSECSIAHAEQLKTEMNREVGKLIASRTGKVVDFEKPEIVVMLDLAAETLSLQIRSLYIEGRYKKLIRGIPQTRWPCRNCKGRGCEKCNFTGKQYPESVDELIKKDVVDAASAADTAFHGAGREDIDALMLGSGRPFVVEAISPRIRTIDLKQLQEAINTHAGGKVEVHGLQVVSKDTVEKLKAAHADKVYNLKVTFTDPVSKEELISALESLSGAEIQQRTPQRVSHRRADLIRKRYVHVIELLGWEADHAIVRVSCEGGLYVKELVSGDEGRTVPSLTGILGKQATVAELDVVNVDI